MRKEFTIGCPTNKKQAVKTAEKWRNPKIGYHTQVIKQNGLWKVRLVIND